MPATSTSSRPFVPGTTGWTVHDLDDPEIERQWFEGRYEIVEGVLTTMPAAYFAGGNALFNLARIVKNHIEPTSLNGKFATEVDVVVDEQRVGRSVAAFLLPEDEIRQKEATLAAGRRDSTRTRILVPPTLIVESISPGHERHDLQTKRRWYSEFGVKNYWIVNAFDRSLICLELQSGGYVEVAAGRDEDEVRPPFFPGLVVPLKRVWED
jgi:Uma2 family endonuclease